MIECKDILALCDRFEDYLVPLDIYVLRQRYNGKVLKSTYAVAHDMAISDETVRTIENRALECLSHCVELEAHGLGIIPMRLAKSLQQSFAMKVCSSYQGSIGLPCQTAHRGELIIHSAGHLIGRVLLVDCHLALSATGSYPNHWQLYFKQPERFADPIRHKGHQGFFYIDKAVAQQLPPRYTYRYNGGRHASHVPGTGV